MKIKIEADSLYELTAMRWDLQKLQEHQEYKDFFDAICSRVAGEASIIYGQSLSSFIETLIFEFKQNDQ